MPPLLCPSPLMLDQSFPRTRDELDQVVDALAKLQELIEKDEACVVLTDALALFIELYEWERERECMPLLLEIHRLVNAWLVHPGEQIVKADVDNVVAYTPHPIPSGCPTEVPLISDWSDEVGRLLALHDCSGESNYFIGIACVSALAGKPISSYKCTPSANRFFPIVGPDNLGVLSDAFEWDLPPQIHHREVGVEQARKYLHLIGASNIRKSRGGGSHNIATFPGQRSWTLDTNDDPVPNTYLDQLVPITGYPIDAIRYILTEGRIPPKKLRIPVRGG